MSGVRRPRIGLTTSFRCDGQRAYHDGCQHALPDAYVRAVAAAGGLPLLIPSLPGEAFADDLLASIDGLLLTGGVDVNPARFGALPAPWLGEVSPERDALELPLVRAALAAGVPVLAICRGVQVLNVAAGGTLVQDIAAELPRALKHGQQAPRGHATHPVEIAPGTRLERLCGTGLWVNSFHHQAVASVAPGFAVAARAPDGVVEAIELADPRRFALGVQWHPESMPEGQGGFPALFRELVAAARREPEAAGRQSAAREEGDDAPAVTAARGSTRRK